MTFSRPEDLVAFAGAHPDFFMLALRRCVGRLAQLQINCDSLKQNNNDKRKLLNDITAEFEDARLDWKIKSVNRTLGSLN